MSSAHQYEQIYRVHIRQRGNSKHLDALRKKLPTLRSCGIGVGGDFANLVAARRTSFKSSDDKVSTIGYDRIGDFQPHDHASLHSRRTVCGPAGTTARAGQAGQMSMFSDRSHRDTDRSTSTQAADKWRIAAFFGHRRRHSSTYEMRISQSATWSEMHQLLRYLLGSPWDCALTKWRDKSLHSFCYR